MLAVNFNSFLQERYSTVAQELKQFLYIQNYTVSNSGILIPRDSLHFKISSFKDALGKLDNSLMVEENDLGYLVRYSKDSILSMRKEIMDKSIKIIHYRVDNTGTKEINIQRVGHNKIILEVPGLDNPEQIKKILGRTAKLSFHMMNALQPFSRDPYNQLEEGQIVVESFYPSIAGYYKIYAKPEITGDALLNARVSMENFKVSIVFRLNSAASARFAQITSNNVGRPFAIVLDNKILTTPVINEPILGGSGSISGKFTYEEAQDLANMIRSGSLPAPLEIVSERVIGPSIGRDAIGSAKLSFTCGLVLMFVFMTITYRGLGVIASIAILLNFVIAISVMALLHITLTLPGIAGLILTLGMAIDANVLIYERMKEEQKGKIKDKVQIVNRSFKNSLSAILDSNITTILSALSLMAVSTGFVRGFATSLTIGILCSMFTAITATRTIIDLVLHFKSSLLHIPVSQIPSNRSIIIHETS